MIHCDRDEFGMASISERESGEIEAANASGARPVVFIHGLWLLPNADGATVSRCARPVGVSKRQQD
jgi:hypothetical protein